jgi:hypothetical protein
LICLFFGAKNQLFVLIISLSKDQFEVGLMLFAVLRIVTRENAGKR